MGESFLTVCAPVIFMQSFRARFYSSIPPIKITPSGRLAAVILRKAIGRRTSHFYHYLKLMS